MAGHLEAGCCDPARPRWPLRPRLRPQQHRLQAGHKLGRAKPPRLRKQPRRPHGATRPQLGCHTECNPGR
eukprot:15205235-Alexandrium_andersonii.AAC.1